MKKLYAVILLASLWLRATAQTTNVQVTAPARDILWPTVPFTVSSAGFVLTIPARSFTITVPAQVLTVAIPLSIYSQSVTNYINVRQTNVQVLSVTQTNFVQWTNNTLNVSNFVAAYGTVLNWRTNK